MQQAKVHVVGVLTHGHGEFTFVDYGQYSDDSNLTASVLFATLKTIARKKPLPKVLYLQMDNASGQNKNKYILGFLAYLTEYSKR